MRPPGRIKGFTPFSKRWVVERTNAWNGRCRRHSKDYERTVESSAAMIQVSQTPAAAGSGDSRCPTIANSATKPARLETPEKLSL